jgi:hypothetical protein
MYELFRFITRKIMKISFLFSFYSFSSLSLVIFKAKMAIQDVFVRQNDSFREFFQTYG